MQLINDKGLRDKMGNTGYNTVIERYSKARLVKDVKKLYLDFLERVEVSERQVATV